jgi:hypothetical protein
MLRVGWTWYGCVASFGSERPSCPPSLTSGVPVPFLLALGLEADAVGRVVGATVRIRSVVGAIPVAGQVLSLFTAVATTVAQQLFVFGCGYALAALCRVAP